MSSIPNEALIRAAELFSAAKYAVAFTGAGFSTPSGIPDFRTERTGLWRKDDPMRVASLTAFRNRPTIFFNWLRPLAKSAFYARPNLAHIALANLEATGVIKAVITQNIDNLHQKAGSKSVVEVHGSMNSLTCPICRESYSISAFVEPFFEMGELPYCPDCHTLLKPDIVLFEEMLPLKAWSLAEMHCDNADLILVAGSSLEVSPANSLPVYALRNGAVLIINNLSSTFLDNDAQLIFPFDVVDFIPSIAKILLGR